METSEFTSRFYKWTDGYPWILSHATSDILFCLLISTHGHKWRRQRVSERESERVVGKKQEKLDNCL